MLHQARVLLGELGFAWSHCAGVGSFADLAGRTVRFHLANKLGRDRRVDEPARPIRVKLLGGRRDVWLRTTAGDIFIFYEILRIRPYRLPEEANADRVKWIIDCGGNIGLTALYFAEHYPQARVVVVEPLPQNLELRRNVAGVDRITVVPGCVAPRSGTAHFTTDNATWGNSMADKPTGLEVRAFTPAELMDLHGAPRADILKVDIEGGEVPLFADAAFLDRVSTVVIELHPPYDFDAFAKAVAPRGFVAQPIDTAADRPMVTARRIAT